MGYQMNSSTSKKVQAVTGVAYKSVGTVSLKMIILDAFHKLTAYVRAYKKG